MRTRARGGVGAVTRAAARLAAMLPRAVCRVSFAHVPHRRGTLRLAATCAACDAAHAYRIAYPLRTALPYDAVAAERQT
jgi:hypothetical protein